jgi:nitrite reductase/ring-hydroxylating ferredoxin subunit
MANDLIRVGTFSELQQQGPKVVRGAGRATVVFVDDGKISDVDNRCPHLGFPLHRGTVKDGRIVIHAGRLYQQMSA